MERNEYKQFMEHIYRRYVTGRARGRFHPMKWDMRHHELGRLHRAMKRIRAVEETTEEDDEIYYFFQQEGLARTVDEVAGGAGWTNRFGEESGI